MITDYTIKNFRVFDADGAEFKIAPITILTGCNSSGKSSVIKSMMLLKEWIKTASKEFSARGEFHPNIHTMNFSAKGLNLKSFDSTVNRYSDDENITLSYTAKWLDTAYRVELIIGAKNCDIFNNGRILQLNLYSLSGTPILGVYDGYLYYLDLTETSLMTEFLAAAWEATDSYVSNKLVIHKSCLDINERDLNYWDDREKCIWKKIESNKKTLTIVQNFGPELSEMRKEDYENALEIFSRDGVILYFPVLEYFRCSKKTDVRSILTKLWSTAYLNENNTAIVNRIADAFEASEFTSFIDYYVYLQNKWLSNVAQSDSAWREGDLFSDVEETATIKWSKDNRNCESFNNNTSEVDINCVYEFLARVQYSDTSTYDDSIISFSEGPNGYVSQTLYSAYVEFIKQLIAHVLFPNTFERLQYICNFQFDIKRIYNFDDHLSTRGNTIKTFLEYKSRLERVQSESSCFECGRYEAGHFVNKWIKKLGIGHSMNIIADEDGLGAKLFIRKESRQKGYPLADEGYGISQVVTFLLHIENEIILDRLIDTCGDFNGYWGTVPAEPTLAIEEPEVGLHPSMQSRLADIFYDAYKNYGIHFIIETHSEYLIRRTQAIVAGYKTNKEYKDKPFSVYYIAAGGQAYQLVYEKSGRFSNSFGPGFFDEASRSSLAILKREKQMRHEND